MTTNLHALEQLPVGTRPVRLYTGPLRPEVPLQRLNWLVRPYWDRGRSEEEKLGFYGARARAASLVDDPSEAEAVLLPEFWGHRDRQTAAELAEVAARAGLPLVVVADGDPEPLVPVPHAMLVHQGLHRSAPQVCRVSAMPHTTEDRLALRGGFTARPWHAEPTVGFCGQGTASLAARAALAARAVGERLAARAGRLDVVPIPLPTHLRLRADALAVLERHPGIRTEFVVRDRYRAGHPRAGAEHETVVEFDRNVLGTDYTVCVRGSGNFSVRLYETLSLGRIPLLIDTDCVLPFEDHIDWDALCVRVPADQLQHAGDILLEHHRAIGPDEFVDRQRRCRATWEEWLSLDGCWSHVRELFGL